jgi:hypothetical protein
MVSNWISFLFLLALMDTSLTNLDTADRAAGKGVWHGVAHAHMWGGQKLGDGAAQILGTVAELGIDWVR